MRERLHRNWSRGRWRLSLPHRIRKSITEREIIKIDRVKNNKIIKITRKRILYLRKTYFYYKFLHSKI